MTTKSRSPGRRSDMKVRVVFLLILLLVIASPITTAQSEREFIDKANGFKITLVGRWRADSYTDAIGRQKTEFIFEKRDQGLLRITRENLGGSSLKDLVRREIDNFTLCNSCVFTGQEEFCGGALSGIRVSHYFVEGDRRMVGTFYFFQDRESVWILHFNGRAESTGMARETTDAMVRSFSSVWDLY
jgi:hypothetical protein